MRRLVTLAFTSALLVATATSATASATPPRLMVDSYVVAAQARHLALSIEDNSTEDGAHAVLEPLERLREQQWALGENDITPLENLGTGKCLRFASTASTPGNPVVQSRCTYGDRQTWYYVAADEHFETWRFQNVATDTCIAALDLAPGARLVEEPCDEDDVEQRWTSIEVEE
ncbi:ricin-type beta-trefoil lectin domain protein [Actinosynnema sp. NPDC051121]|nr:hypothetical protein [Saccharothrix sp.]